VKKKIIKSVLKTVTFVLIFILLFAAISETLISYDFTAYQNITAFYDESKSSLDAVYIGSSNCFAYWNPLLAWNRYGIAVYPYACNSNPFFSTEYLIREARKTQPDAVFIVNINTLSDGEIEYADMHNLLDCMPLSLNKIKLINHLTKMGGYTASESLEFYLPIIRYHSRWAELSKSDIEEELYGLKGASKYDAYLFRVEDISDRYILTDERSTLSAEAISSTNSMLDYCDEENISVIFVTVPQARLDENDISRYNALNALIESRGYTTLNLLDKTDEIGLDKTTDFYNIHHTNIHGSVKFTYYLAEYLIEQYGFTNKAADNTYDSWNESYNKYADIIAPFFLSFESTPEIQSKDLKAPSLSVCIGKDASLVQWDKIEGADGYEIYYKDEIKNSWTRIADVTSQSVSLLLSENEDEPYCTVVPYSVKNGIRYYGNYSYLGILLKDVEPTEVQS